MTELTDIRTALARMRAAEGPRAVEALLDECRKVVTLAALLGVDPPIASEILDSISRLCENGNGKETA